MANGQVKSKALQNIPLLRDVIAFKEKFYRCPWARYHEAIPGTMKLIPQERYFSALKDDYMKMREMIYGVIPEFPDIILRLQELEDEINELEKVR